MTKLIFFSVVLLMGSILSVKSASADTQYNIYGTGRTYQNNKVYSCISWGYSPGQSYCYLGIWSDTQYQPNNVVEVVEWGKNLGQVCQGTPPYQVCSTEYQPMNPNPLAVTALSVAATNGAHYDNDVWPSNTRGYASHMNYTYSSTEIWWTSDGY